ncbi:MAG: hypothetical protein KDA21_09050 [Phycisphaerales bacterium]|nr:hypothetical protein [Phycisphaerales bacterium]
MTRAHRFLSRFTMAAALVGAVGALAALPASTLADDDGAPRGVGVGTEFTYQGRLLRNGVPGNGQFDMIFRLYTASAGGVQVGGNVTLTNITVNDGLFTVSLDFGDVFNGSDRFLSIAVRNAGVGSYIGLTPRQAITPTPYAMYAQSGGSVRSLQDAYDGGETIITDHGNVVIEGPGAAQFGTVANPTGSVNVYFPSTPLQSITMREHFGGEQGGAMTFYRGGSGSGYCFIEPEGSTIGDYGAWFSLSNSNGAAGLVYDADSSGTGDSRFYVSDSGGTFTVELNSADSNSKIRLPGSSVGSAEILDESGVAHAHGNASGPALSNVTTNIGSRTITVPGPGYVIAIGTAELFCNDTASWYQLGVSSTSAAFEDGLEFLQVLPSGVAFDTSTTVQSVFNVTAAGSHTFYFVGNSAPANSADVSDWSLTLIYVPTSYGTVSATGPEFPNLNDKQARQLMGPQYGPTPADLAAEVAQSKADNQARLQRELNEMQAQLERLRREIENNQGNSN